MEPNDAHHSPFVKCPDRILKISEKKKCRQMVPAAYGTEKKEPVCRCSHSQAAFHSQCFQLGGESMAVEENFPAAALCS
jgi:hypothetical protein